MRVEAFLVTSSDNAYSDRAQSLVNVSVGNMDSVRHYVPNEERALARLDLVDAPTPAYLTPQYFLPVARAFFFKDRCSFWRRAILWSACIAIFLFARFCRKRNKIGGKMMTKPDLFFAFLGILMTWVVGRLGLREYEKHVEGDFSTVLRSLKSLTRCLLPWFARTPVTSKGQTTATIIRYVMLLIFGGALWPYMKKFSKDWLWPRLARGLSGGRFAACHNHISR